LTPYLVCAAQTTVVDPELHFEVGLKKGRYAPECGRRTNATVTPLAVISNSAEETRLCTASERAKNPYRGAVGIETAQTAMQLARNAGRFSVKQREKAPLTGGEAPRALVVL
jgi:hypothetical protein